MSAKKIGVVMKRVLLCLLVNLCVYASRVYLIPCKGLSMEQLTAFPGTGFGSAPFIHLKAALESEGYEVFFSSDGVNIEDPIAIISFGRMDHALLRELGRFPREQSLLFSFEPPVVSPKVYNPSYTYAFGKVFVLWQDVVDNVRYFKFHYPQPRLSMIESEIPFKEKKLAALIAGNKNSVHAQSLYAGRLDLIKFFEKVNPSALDLYGPGWDGFLSWKGCVSSKWETLKHYKFGFCYENMHSQRGYITEKIFDVMVSGCVPVYLGAVDITDYVPATCFVDRRSFSSNKELYTFLERMDESTHAGYLKAIRDFFASEEAKLFSVEHFAEEIIREIHLIEKIKK